MRDIFIFQRHCIPSLILISRAAHLKLIAGHGVTPPGAGSEALTKGTCFTTENASLRRAARLLNCDTFCKFTPHQKF